MTKTSTAAVLNVFYHTLIVFALSEIEHRDGSPIIIWPKLEDLSARVGDELQCKASADHPASMQMLIKLGGNWRLVAVSDSNTVKFVLPESTPLERGLLRCKARNEKGNVDKLLSLTVKEPIVPVSLDMNQSVMDIFEERNVTCRPTTSLDEFKFTMLYFSAEELQIIRDRNDSELKIKTNEIPWTKISTFPYSIETVTILQPSKSYLEIRAILFASPKHKTKFYVTCYGIPYPGKGESVDHTKKITIQWAPKIIDLYIKHFPENDDSEIMVKIFCIIRSGDATYEEVAPKVTVGRKTVVHRSQDKENYFSKGLKNTKYHFSIWFDDEDQGQPVICEAEGGHKKMITLIRADPLPVIHKGMDSLKTLEANTVTCGTTKANQEYVQSIEADFCGRFVIFNRSSDGQRIYCKFPANKKDMDEIVDMNTTTFPLLLKKCHLVILPPTTEGFMIHAIIAPTSRDRCKSVCTVRQNLNRGLSSTKTIQGKEQKWTPVITFIYYDIVGYKFKSLLVYIYCDIAVKSLKSLDFLRFPTLQVGNRAFRLSFQEVKGFSRKPYFVIVRFAKVMMFQEKDNGSFISCGLRDGGLSQSLTAYYYKDLIIPKRYWEYFRIKSPQKMDYLFSRRESAIKFDIGKLPMNVNEERSITCKTSSTFISSPAYDRNTDYLILSLCTIFIKVKNSDFLGEVLISYDFIKWTRILEFPYKTKYVTILGASVLAWYVKVIVKAAPVHHNCFMYCVSGSPFPESYRIDFYSMKRLVHKIRLIQVHWDPSIIVFTYVTILNKDKKTSQPLAVDVICKIRLGPGDQNGDGTSLEVKRNGAAVKSNVEGQIFLDEEGYPVIRLRMEVKNAEGAIGFCGINGGAKETLKIKGSRQ